MDINEFIQKLFARAKEAGFADCEAYLVSGEEFEACVLNGAVIDYNVSGSLGLGFRALVNGKMGYASTQVLDEEALQMLVTAAAANAAMVENEDEQFIYPGDETYPTLDVYNEAIDHISAAEKIDMALKLEKAVLEMDERVGQVERCGVMQQSGSRRIVNSKGLDVSFRDNAIGLYVIPVAREGERANTGFDYALERDDQRIDIDKIARAAVAEAVSGLTGSPVPSGTYKIVLRNDVAAAMLSTYASVFSADAAQKGFSLLKGREGEAIAAEIVTLLDDPGNPAGLAATPFDAEGVATRRKEIISGGALQTLLHNLKTAAKQGVASTGNAAKRSYTSPVTVAPSNFYFAPGEKSPEALYEMVGTGLLITDLSGLHAGANTVSGDFSLGAKGFVIENGKKGRAVDQITLAGNFYTVLKEITAVGNDLRFGMPGASCVGSPSLVIENLSVAGQ